MSGAGFEFEDLISASYLLKMLSGERATSIGLITQVQAQVSALGWHIDDLLITASEAHVTRRLAISVKGNLQVTATGLPADFATRAWEQWRDIHGPFNRETDDLALVTLGIHQDFDPSWREVKNACSGSDTNLAISRIRSNKRQSSVFDSVQNPGGASDEETIKLIRHLHVIPTDWQFAHSEHETQAIAQCRHLLISGNDVEAQALWDNLIDIAKDVRIRSGTILVLNLLSSLRGRFGLRQHPDYERDWETLIDITADYKARIETELPSGHTVARAVDEKALRESVIGHSITVVVGESGSGKSALVKSMLDRSENTWSQVWLDPDVLKTALSASRRGTLPLGHELSQVLNNTVRPQNVLVIDSAERIETNEFVVVRQLLQTILSGSDGDAKDTWRVVIVAQPNGWGDGGEKILNGRDAHLIEVGKLHNNAVKLALVSSPFLGWLTAHEETISALTNLRTLAWVIQAGTALGVSPNVIASHTDIADRLWKYWTRDRVDVQAMVMRLAQREALFERSFALTDLEPSDTVTFAGCPEELPLRMNQRSNRIEFEHDLAADWARFQFLKQIWTDTAQWASLASHPLWTNALRMLGQFLLRQSSEKNAAWDLAFKAAAVEGNDLAGNILLDSLCLDPNAERFLSDRVQLLFQDGAKFLARLLLRFQHIATVPTSAAPTLDPLVGLYLETRYRSIVFDRWPPVLRFLIAHRDRLDGMVLSALAKVIETWLTKTPNTQSDNTPGPYRREMAEIALAMTRTVQVEKGQGVMYLNHEPSLYRAVLAGAADLPTEVGNWALELAGRREIDAAVAHRISEAQTQKAKAHSERLNSDLQYKAKFDARKQAASSLRAFRTLLPPWPLGAFARVDRDFRSACIKENGIQFLMRAQPELAAEVLLALIIQEQPEMESGSAQLETDLGLEYPLDAYPTAFWKSPFFHFLQLAPETALTSLIKLVNFCTDRWAAEFTKRWADEAPGVTFEPNSGTKKIFVGGRQVFNWPQSNDSIRNGNLFCALDALERWLTLRLDAGQDITPDIETILREGSSTAIVSVLINVAKFRPSLLEGSLADLIILPDLFFWDRARVKQLDHNFIGWSWLQSGEMIFNVAREWVLAPHRQRTFYDVVVDQMLTSKALAHRLHALQLTWMLPDAPKERLEFKLLSAGLDRVNYHPVIDPETGTEKFSLVYPEELRLELTTWQTNSSIGLTYLLVPDRCEQKLQREEFLDNDEARYLFDLLRDSDSAKNGEDEEARSTCRFAAAGSLIVLGEDWLAQNPAAQKQAFETIRSGVAAVASTGEDIRARRIGGLRDELKFVAYAVMHLWLAEGNNVRDWEYAVLRILTSGDQQAVSVVVSIAYANRDKLGFAWWRLLRAGLFWSALVMLAPRHSGDGVSEHIWSVWLARLRRFQLRGKTSSSEELDFDRIVAGLNRINFQLRRRVYSAGNHTWRGKPKLERGASLDGHFLEHLFDWLIQGAGTGNHDADKRLALRIWNYDAARAQANSREYGEYDLPSQNLGYSILQKLGALSIAEPPGKDQRIWRTVLSHGPAAHCALRHFIKSLFLRLSKGDDSAAFERVWRESAEYGISADWSQPGLWFHGERLLGDLMGFSSEDTLLRLQPGAALRMRDLYEDWALAHLGRNEECITRFCHFLTTEFGAPLRLDGLCWLSAALKKHYRTSRWSRQETSDALLALLVMVLKSEAANLSRQTSAREGLVDICAALATRNIPAALSLQEHIKQLR